MPETHWLVNRPVKFEDLWFKAFGQLSAWGEGGCSQEAAGGGSLTSPPGNIDRRYAARMWHPGLYSLWWSCAFPRQHWPLWACFRGKGAIRLGRVSGQQWCSLLNTQVKGTLLSQCPYHMPAGGIQQLDREVYNPSHFVARAMAADCCGPSYHEVIKSKASMRCFICSSKLCSLVIPWSRKTLVWTLFTDDNFGWGFKSKDRWWWLQPRARIPFTRLSFPARSQTAGSNQECIWQG